MTYNLLAINLLCRNGDQFMEQTFVYFQPEYMNEFKCDGQSCHGHCCKYWNIDIDKNTYKKYASIKPNLKSKEITQKIRFEKENDKYYIQLNDKHFCPFLTDDNWCYIQRNYGADFLSNTCMTYPRKTFRIGDFFERSLTLTCPVAANLILNRTEPISFEQTEISIKDYMDTCRNVIKVINRSKEILDNTIPIQYAAISILQERRLSIDQRLIVMGYYFNQLEEIIEADKFDEIETLSMIYTSEDFFKTQVPMLIKSVTFNVRDYIKIMFDVFGMLYADNNDAKVEAKRYLDYIVELLEIKIDTDGTASVSELVESYNKHSSEREKFMEQNAIIFENYLVNEFFYGFYPWHINGSASLNYGLFIVTYKILELLALSMTVSKNVKIDAPADAFPNNQQIIELIRWFALKLDHNRHYIDSISEGLKDKNKSIEIMRSLLQG